MGTGEPVPLSMLTIEQLCEVAEFTPTNEKKAVIITEEDKRILEGLVKEAKKESEENSANSTGNLVEWIYSRIVLGLVRGLIRSVTVIPSRGTRFFLLPKRNIWSKKGGRLEKAVDSRSGKGRSRN